MPGERPGAAACPRGPGVPAIAGSQHERWGAAVARKMQIPPADDTGSSAAAGAARSGLDGTGFETGLNAGQSRQLRDALPACTRARRRVNGGSRCLPGAGAADRRASRTPPGSASGPGPRAPKSKTADETRQAGRQAQNGDQPVDAQHSPATSNRPPGTSGHSSP